MTDKQIDFAHPADDQETRMALKLAVDALCRIYNIDDLAQAKQIAIETIEKLSPLRVVKTGPPVPFDLEEDAP